MDQRLTDPAGAGPVDWRGLCQDLLDEVLARPLIPDRALIDRARAVLARYGHQPAPPAEEKLSDEDCWQWYTYCPEEGLEIYSDREQAQSAAQSIMDSYEVAAHSDGWHEDMESVSWGMLVPVEQAQVVERKKADPDSEFDEWVKYELKPARAAAEGEVAELVAWLHGQDGGIGRRAIYSRIADLLSQRHPAPVPVSERLPELRGMFERILCVARSSEQRPVGNIQLADRLISAVVSWSALPLPQGEEQP